MLFQRAAVSLLIVAALAGCASKTLPPDSLWLNGHRPYMSVRANIDAQTAVLHAHWIPQEDGKPDRHDIEVMSYITTRPLPTGDFEIAKAFIRLKCADLTEVQINQSIIYAGANGYYRFANLPCDLVVQPLLGSSKQLS